MRIIIAITLLMSVEALGMSKLRALWEDVFVSRDNRPTIAVLFTQSTKTSEEEYENLADVARFAMEQWERTSGTKSPLKIISVDDGDSPETAKTNLERAFKRHQIVAVVGPIYSRVAMGLKDYIEEKKVPLISIFATHNDLTKSNRYIFRICASNRSLVSTMVDHLFPLVKEHGLNVITFKDVTDSYSVDLSDNFKDAFKAQKVAVHEVAFRGLTGLENLRDLNSRVWNPTKKDVLFLPNRDIVAGKILAALESEPYAVAAVDTVNFLPLMERIKPHETHIRIVTAFQWLAGKSPYSSSIEDLFKSHFRRDMTITSALTFDATMTVIEAYKRAEVTHAQLVDVLRDGTVITGVTGKIILDQFGERKSVEKFFKEELIR